MKTLQYGLIAVALAATAVSSQVGSHFRHAPMSIGSRAVDGAFRDGLFLGQRDRSQGFRHHLAIGRWNSSADRHSFVVGYEQGFSDPASN